MPKQNQMPRRAKPSQQLAQIPRKKKRVRRRNKPTAGRCPDGAAYVKCALGLSAGSAKIPDESTRYSMPLDYTATVTLSPDSTGNLVVGCLPGLPGSLRVIRGAGTITARDGSAATITSAFPAGVTIPFTDYTQLNVTPGTDQANYSNGIIAARTTAYSLEVMQVGPILSQQGNAVTAQVPPGLDFMSMPELLKPNAADVLYVGHTFAGLNAGQPVRSMGAETVGLAYSNISTFPGSSVCTALTPCELRGVASDHEYVPAHNAWSYYNDTGNYKAAGNTVVFGSLSYALTPGAAPFRVAGNTINSAIDGFSGNTNIMFPLFPLAADIQLVGDHWTDPYSDMLIWAGANLGTTTVFEFKVSVCLEVIVSHYASVYRPFLTPPAEYDPIALATVAKVAKLAPSSISKNDSGMSSWWSGLTEAVVGIGDVVSSFGIPVVSPIAGAVSKMVNRLMS